MVKLLCKNKQGWDEISNFRPLTMLLAKILANRLQTVLPNLICPEQTCAVKSRTVQDSLYMVRTIIEKVDWNTALINLDQPKDFDRVDHGFLEAVLSAADFGPPFRSWIRLLYASPQSHFGSERGKIEALHLDSVDLLKLSAYAVQVEGEPGPTRAHVTLLPEITRYTAYADDVSVPSFTAWS